MAFGASLTVLDHLMLKWPPGIFTGLEYLVLVAVLLVVDGEGLAGLDPLGEGVSAQTGRVGFVDVTEIRVFLRDSVGDLESRVDQFDSVLGTFQDRTAVYLDEFVHVAEAWSGKYIYFSNNVYWFIYNISRNKYKAYSYHIYSASCYSYFYLISKKKDEKGFYANEN